jgi:hypothetical protein
LPTLINTLLQRGGHRAANRDEPFQRFTGFSAKEPLEKTETPLKQVVNLEGSWSVNITPAIVFLSN